MFKRYIGDKKFYKMVLAIALPIVLQNAVTNFVNMLDNIMIGRAYACLTTAFPGIYNATSIKSLATGLILTGAVVMPVNFICHACYFTLRAGGKTWITFVFDSLFVRVLSVPLAFVLVRHTSIHIILVYGAIQALDILKCVLGIALIKKGVWIQSII